MSIEENLKKGNDKSRIAFLAKDVLFYGLAGLLVSLVNILTLPMLTHNMSIENYGKYELLLSIIGISIVICTAGQDSAFARFCYDTENPEKRRHIINTGFFSILGICCLFILLLFIFLLITPFGLIDHSESGSLIVVFTTLIIILSAELNYVRNVLKWTFLRLDYIITSLAYSLLLLAGIYVTIVYLRLDLEGVLITLLISASLPLLFGVWRANFLQTKKLDSSFLVPMLRYGFPYLLLGILNQGIRMIDKIFITYLDGPSAVAVYSVGFRVASLMVALESVFHLAWGPISYAIHKEKNAVDTYGLTLNIVTWAVGLILLIFSGFAQEIVSIFAPTTYAAADTVTVILATGFAFQAIAGISSLGIELAKKPSLLLISWTAGIVVAIFGMLSLGRMFGITGVASAISLGLISESIIRTLLARRLYPIHFNNSKWMLFIPASAILMVAVNSLPYSAQQLTYFKIVIICTVFLFGTIKAKKLLTFLASEHPKS